MFCDMQKRSTPSGKKKVDVHADIKVYQLSFVKLESENLKFAIYIH